LRIARNGNAIVAEPLNCQRFRHSGGQLSHNHVKRCICNRLSQNKYVNLSDIHWLNTVLPRK